MREIIHQSNTESLKNANSGDLFVKIIKKNDSFDSIVLIKITYIYLYIIYNKFKISYI